MLNISSMVEANFGAWVINRAYDRVADSIEAVASGDSINDGTASAIIQMLLRGDIAASQEGARNAGDAISMVQTFEAAASSIDQTLIQMQELATQAATGTYSDEQKAVMQAEFEELADEINDIVDNTEFNDNQLLGSDGATIEISIGNGSSIDIASADLSFDTEGLDLTTDAQAVLDYVEDTIETVTAYRAYLGTQENRLEKTAALIEFDIVQAMDYETTISNTDLAMEIANEVMGKVMMEFVILLRIQANVAATTAFQLLDNEYYTD